MAFGTIEQAIEDIRQGKVKLDWGDEDVSDLPANASTYAVLRDVEIWKPIIAFAEDHGVKIVVKQHGGSIEFESEPGFTEFIITLPQANASVAGKLE